MENNADIINIKFEALYIHKLTSMDFLFLCSTVAIFVVHRNVCYQMPASKVFFLRRLSLQRLPRNEQESPRTACVHPELQQLVALESMI